MTRESERALCRWDPGTPTKLALRLEGSGVHGSLQSACPTSHPGECCSPAGAPGNPRAPQGSLRPNLVVSILTFQSCMFQLFPTFCHVEENAASCDHLCLLLDIFQLFAIFFHGRCSTFDIFQLFSTLLRRCRRNNFTTTLTF